MRGSSNSAKLQSIIGIIREGEGEETTVDRISTTTAAAVATEIISMIHMPGENVDLYNTKDIFIITKNLSIY